MSRGGASRGKPWGECSLSLLLAVACGRAARGLTKGAHALVRRASPMRFGLLVGDQVASAHVPGRPVLPDHCRARGSRPRAPQAPTQPPCPRRPRTEAAAGRAAVDGAHLADGVQGERRAPAETACRLPRGAGLLPLRDSAWKRPVGRVRRDGYSGGSWPRRPVAGGPPAASAPTYLRVLRLWAVRPSPRAGGPHRGEPGSCSRLKLPLAARRPHNYTWKAAELARGHTVWACVCVGGARRAPGVSGPAARAECPGEGEGDTPPAASGRPRPQRSGRVVRRRPGSENWRARF